MNSVLSRVLFVACVIGLPAFSHAAPSVSGNTISWPDDGWYQVQRVTDVGQIEVCQGGRRCEVEAGEYIVINLSTGERFTGIVVSSEPVTTGVTVNGNVISWPDDGWYQVQNRDTYEVVCAGTRYCTVEPGVYIVINHTTGERFENVEVTQGGEPDSPIVVTGHVISWPDDGWYQVQDELTYTQVCGGGRSCTVEPGSYVVINHTLGLRYEHIVVVETEPSSVISVDDRELILTNVVAVLSGEVFRPAFEQVELMAFSVEGRTLVSGSLEGEGGTNTAEYACDGGGQVERSVSVVKQSTYDAASAQACQFSQISYDGKVSVSRVADETYQAIVDGFVASHADGGFTAMTSERTHTAVNGKAQSDYLEVALFQEVLADGSATIIREASTRLSSEGSDHSLSSYKAQITAPWTHNEVLLVSTPIEFSQPVRDRVDLGLVYTVGKLLIEAADGSRLVVDADNGDPLTFALTVDSGASSTTVMASWEAHNILPCYALNQAEGEEWACAFKRDSLNAQ